MRKKTRMKKEERVIFDEIIQIMKAKGYSTDSYSSIIKTIIKILNKTGHLK